jgi:hypothetical protein
VMITGGGYNCRHQFRRVSALDVELLDLVDTDTRYQDRHAPKAPSGSGSAELTAAEQQAVKDYSFGNKWEPLNEALRDGRPLTDEQQEMVRNLDSAIAKSDPLAKDTTLYRGVNFGNQGMPSGSDLAGRSKAAGEDLIRSSIADWAERTYQPGDTLQLGGYQSTSRDIQPALDASSSRKSPGVIFEIVASKGLDLAKLASSAVDDESEVLLSRFTTYRVDSVIRSQSYENAGGETVTRTVIRVVQTFGGKR